MKNKHFLTRALLATAMVFLTTAMCFGQCVIPVTDSQPYLEDFEGDGFDCWTVEANGGDWTVLAGTNSNVASFSYQNDGDEARLISPVFDLSAVDAAIFSFSYAMMGMYQNDELEVSYRSSENDEWHTFGSFSLSDYSNFFEEVYELENLSATYQISFLGRGLGGMYIFVDNVEVISRMGCARPVGLQVTDITATSALLSWSTNGNEESWVLDFNGVEIPVSSQPYLMDNLRPETQYTFRVKANCTDGTASEWATPISFTTYCDVITVTDDEPYKDDFEGSDNFVCWQNEIVSGDGGWTVDPGYVILNNTAFFIWMNEEARLVSAPLDITAVTSPTIEFRHKQPMSDYGTNDELSVWYRISPSDEWKLIEIYIYAAEDWETGTFSLPEVSSTFQICFDGVSHNGNGVYVDDVKVGDVSVVGVAETPAVAATVSPNPTHGIVTIEANVVDGEVVVFDMMGKQVTKAALAEGRAHLDLSGFAKGVYMARIIGPKGATSVKLVKE